jgi:ribosomal protein S27E
MPEDIVEIKCPGCGEMLEFFKDETSQKCPRCGQTVTTPGSEPN